VRGVYLGNMTGNTVRLGVAATRRDWGSVAVALQPIASFGIGLLVGALIQDLIRLRRGQRLLPIPLFAEAACLLAIWLRSPGSDWPNAFLGGIAMGIQNTILRNSGVMSMYTTHVTGLLTELSEHVSAVLSTFLRVPHVRAGGGDFELPAGTPGVRHARVAGRLAGFYALWVVGVCAAALVSSLWATRAAIPPAFVVSALAVMTLVHPIPTPDP